MERIQIGSYSQNYDEWYSVLIDTAHRKLVFGYIAIFRKEKTNLRVLKKSFKTLLLNDSTSGSTMINGEWSFPLDLSLYHKCNLDRVQIDFFTFVTTSSSSSLFSLSVSS